MVAFSWSKPGNHVAIISPFNNYNPIPLDVGFLGIITLIIDSEKAIIIAVPQGRIYYRYIVDGVEQHDPDKDSEIYNSKPMLTI